MLLWRLAPRQGLGVSGVFCAGDLHDDAGCFADPDIDMFGKVLGFWSHLDSPTAGTNINFRLTIGVSGRDPPGGPTRTSTET
jgi:hypothetical protein